MKEFQIEFNKLFSGLYRRCRFKGCIFPDKSTCSSKKIKAHSIQKSKILSHIADRGMVISGDIQKTIFTREFEQIGIRTASTFFGFCNHHDTVIFSEIENKDYIANQEQNFLYAYRACALEYGKKKEACCFYKASLNKFKNTPNELFFKSMLNGAILGLGDLSEAIDLFSNELIRPKSNRNFNTVNIKIYKLSYESLIAVNAFFIFHMIFKKIN